MATSSGSVVMLVITPGAPSIAPGAPPECQPTTLMPWATACSTSGACSRASTAPRMMPSGCSAMACDSAEARVEGAPWPSSRRNSQPIASAASLAPSPTPQRAAVALVLRHVDDELVRLRRRAGGRTGPRGHRRGEGLDVGLRLVHERVLRQAPAALSPRTAAEARSIRRHTRILDMRVSSFCCLLASHWRLVRPVRPARNDGSCSPPTKKPRASRLRPAAAFS